MLARRKNFILKILGTSGTSGSCIFKLTYRSFSYSMSHISCPINPYKNLFITRITGQRVLKCLIYVYIFENSFLQKCSTPKKEEEYSYTTRADTHILLTLHKILVIKIKKIGLNFHGQKDGNHFQIQSISFSNFFPLFVCQFIISPHSQHGSILL